MDSDSQLAFFCLLVKQGSLAATARELNLTPPAVSRRLSQLEARLGVRLLNRTTRRISLTNEGEVYFANAMRILGDIDEMERLVSSSREAPKGLLRVNAPLGFGRSYIGPAISGFSKTYPDVEVQLQLTDRPISLPDEAIDVSIRFGDLPDSRLIAKRIAPNRRLLCASPAYLRSAGEPLLPHDLTQHACIVLRQNETAYGNWRLTRGKQTETIKVHGKLSTNDGEVALNWALEGHGILMRAEWDVAKFLRSGRLVQVLTDYATPPADIYAVYLERLNQSAKVSYFVEHLRSFLRHHADSPSKDGSNW
ncbi:MULTISPECIES: LysR family transcriptional regulator [Cupriavidus]|uniref:Transcriptional regulator, LysR family n=1 Tax=Cupriavidus pinatubonensis (strain JMP 134 / LMG 1197) TaxID=264198 RepID=Q46PD6_CUPPJ|nr:MULTISPECIES: LysR family transcriptional regulator [Cupriavidus]QYY29604.1 LysR family transcriptional regulator [Cupriavidus pinatubonensis]TPQ33482.1 LysR family transcriptional regulator [Cupriavidus pinatubonensis]